ELPAHGTVIDIASAPGGEDFEACKRAGIRAKLCPGLPGRFSPLASAQILRDAVIDLI
ncbi:MAG: dipicolinate synthase, partial [Enterocloster sp.]